MQTLWGFFFLSFKSMMNNTKEFWKEKKKIIQYPNYDHFVLSLSGFKKKHFYAPAIIEERKFCFLI